MFTVSSPSSTLHRVQGALTHSFLDAIVCFAIAIAQKKKINLYFKLTNFSKLFQYKNSCYLINYYL